VKTSKFISLVLLISFFVIPSSLEFTGIQAKKEVNILCFIENGFGGSYYINKGFLESYN